MHNLFNLLNGGVIIEVSSLEQAVLAEQSWAVAILLNHEDSPVVNELNTNLVKELIKTIRIPVFISFHHWHHVEFEMLKKLNISWVYADSRLSKVHDDNHQIAIDFPCMEDVWNIWEVSKNAVPVLRTENIEETISKLQDKPNDAFIIVTCDTNSISDIALIKRMKADIIILNNNIFRNIDTKHVKRLVQASLYFDNAEKLATLIN